MQIKTKGFVIRYLKYKETSIIVDIFTRDRGMFSFLVNNVRTRKPTYPISFFQPLTILDLVVYNKNPETLQRFSEARCHAIFNSIHTDIKKSTIALFLSEILYKTLRHESHPESLFDFVESSLAYFDMQDTAVSEFHLKFLLRLTGFLGFSPGSSKILMDQLLQSDLDLEEKIDRLINEDFDSTVIANYTERVRILNHIIDYFKIHIEGFGELKSYKVLRDLLH